MKIKNIAKKVLALSLISSFILVGCKDNRSSENMNLDSENKKILSQTFDDYVREAKGSTVRIYGWGGSDSTNNWIDHYLADKVKKEYGINIKRVGMNIDEILNSLQNSVTAGEKKGNIDIVWINGENFYTAYNNNLLFGPFTEKLPNMKKYVDGNSKDIQYDFGYKTNGYESPFGRAQLVMIYNSDKVRAIKNLDDLKTEVKKYPGKFTYPALPDFTGSAFVRNVLYEKVGYDRLKSLDPKNVDEVRKVIKPAMDYLKEIKPYLWKEGRTYPKDSTEQDNMFADNTLYFDISYNPNFASSMIEKGIFPKSTKTCIFDKGTIGNTHFLAIPKNASNKAGAMVVINSILSFEAQMKKYDPKVWGDLPVLDNNKLSTEERNKMNSIGLGKATLKQDELLSKRQPELNSALVPVIEKIWMEEIPGK